MPPTFDSNALTKLAERTQYECWLLEAAYTLVENELFPSWPDAVIYSAGKTTPQYIMYARGNFNLFDWRPHFLSAGAPLVFVSTFKLLDMLVEWILEENGYQPNYRFAGKLKQLENKPVFPSLIESRTWLKERLTGLYSTLEPLRGTIIHDRCFTSTDGAVRVASSRKGEVGESVEISANQLRTLASIIVSVLRYIDGTWSLDDFREKKIRHDLDALVVLHGLPSLGQKPPFHTCVRVYSSNTDPLLVNPKAIHEDLATQYGNQDCSFDLRVLIVNDGEVVDAYLFPWDVIIGQYAGWCHSISAERYRTPIPDDIVLEHGRLG